LQIATGVLRCNYRRVNKRQPAVKETPVAFMLPTEVDEAGLVEA
jgi:hypothetical protein